MSGTKKCFVICPFDTPNSDVRKRSDMLFEYVVKPAVGEFGYLVDRADLSAQPGIVTIHIIQHLIEDELVLADITDRNPNVFYELAIRHAIRKPYIQAVLSGQTIPFNIQEIQTVVYDLSVDGIKKAIETIKKQVLFYEAGGKVTSPVTVAIDELIGTRSLAQFSEIATKLAELDKSIAKSQELSKQLEDVKSVVLSVKSRLESMSSSGSSNETQSKDSNDPFAPKAPVLGPHEYTVKEWIDLYQKEMRATQRRNSEK